MSERMVLDREGNEYLLKGSEKQTSQGVIKLKDGGTHLRTNTGHEFSVFEPFFLDKWKRIKRGPAALTLKDIGFILAYTGVGPGDAVLEAGSGSGALTLFLARSVAPDGKVFAFDRREDFLKIAKRNAASVGLAGVEFQVADVYEESAWKPFGSASKQLDLVFLDLAEPWRVVPFAEKALKLGGFFACFVPSFEQLKEVNLVLSENGFSKPFNVEGSEREITVKPRGSRPVSKGLTHTGFLTFSRKL